MNRRAKQLLAWLRAVNWQTEPVVVAGVVRAVAAALAGAGLTVSDHLVAAVVAYVTAACMIGAAVFDRRQVTSPATAAANQDQADAQRLGAAAAALASASPIVAERARLCPAAPAEAPGPTFAGAVSALELEAGGVPPEQPPPLG